MMSYFYDHFNTTKKPDNRWPRQADGQIYTVKQALKTHKTD